LCSLDGRVAPPLRPIPAQIHQAPRADLVEYHAMNAVITEARSAGAEGTQIAAALAKWYADHSAIRRLWAFEDRLELKVLVTLEPTSDGDDALPVWLANNRHWQRDLQLRLRREVRLRLLFADTFGESSVELDAVTIAEINWRDPWTASDPFPQ
jgi:hypothetical protein